MRIGIVGAGRMGSTHAASWTNTPARIAGFHAVNPAHAQAQADRFGAKVYDTLDALIDDVDVVDICTPTHLHHPMVLKAAAAGRQIVCEKPLALTMAQGREMLAACERAGVHLLVAHVVRFFPEYATAKAVVERGDIGRVGVVRLTRASYQPKAADNWFVDPARSGGMMLDLMIHDYDYARWIAGDVESVFARSVRASDPDAPSDYALVILRHTSGALSHVEGGWAYPPPMFRTSIEIAGDGGLIEHPAGSSVPLGIHLHGTGKGDADDIPLPLSPLAEDPFTTELKHFYDVLAGKTADLRVTAQDALAALQVALAAIESARNGRRVPIEEVA